MYRTKKTKKFISGERIEAVALAVLPTLLADYLSHPDYEATGAVIRESFTIAERFFDIKDELYNNKPNKETSES